MFSHRNTNIARIQKCSAKRFQTPPFHCTVCAFRGKSHDREARNTITSAHSHAAVGVGLTLNTMKPYPYAQEHSRLISVLKTFLSLLLNAPIR